MASAAARYWHSIHKKKDGWITGKDIPDAIHKTLQIKIADEVLKILMSGQTYQDIFGKSSTGRVKIKRLRKVLNERRTAGLGIKKPKRAVATAKKIHASFVSSVNKCCRRSVFDAIDKEDELKRRGPEVRFGRRSNLLAAESAAADAHSLMYGTKARKPIEKKMTAHQAAKEVKKKLRLNFKSLATAFRQADADKSGSISPRELRCMLTRLGISVSDVEFRKFIKHYDDILSDGKIDFREFCSKFGDGSKPGQLFGPNSNAVLKKKPRSKIAATTAEEAMAIVKRKICEYFSTVQAAFRKIDRDHDGKVSWRELRGMLRGWNLDLNDAEFMRFVQKIQRGLQGKGNFNDITMEQFRCSVLGKAVAASSDNGLMQKNARIVKHEPEAEPNEEKQPVKPLLRLPSIAKKRKPRPYAIPSSRVSRDVLRKTLLMAQRGELPSIHEKPSKILLRNGGDARYQDIYANWKTIRRELGKSDNMSPQKIRLVPSKRFYDVITKTTSLSSTDAMAISKPFLTSGKKEGSNRSFVDWRRLIKHTLQLFQQN